MPISRQPLGAVEIQRATPHLYPSLLDKASNPPRQQAFVILPKTQKFKKHMKNSATQYQGINFQREQDRKTITVLTPAALFSCTYVCMHGNPGDSHPLSQPLNTKLNARACSVGRFTVISKRKFLCLPVWWWCTSRLFEKAQTVSRQRACPLTAGTVGLDVNTVFWFFGSKWI